MRCPACQSPLTESDPACRQCGFSLEVADRVLGIAPSLDKPITDPDQHLGKLARARLKRSIEQLQRKHPQIGIAILLMSIPAQVPAAIYAFWLFNRGQLNSAIDQGGANHLVILLLDPATGQMVSMTGYGLEPFFPQSQLQLCVNVAAQQLQRGGIPTAIEAFLAELDAQLRHLHRQIPRGFGLCEDDQWHDSSQDPGTHGYARAPSSQNHEGEDEY